MSNPRLKRPLGTMAAFWVAVAAIFAAVGSGLAMETTPPQDYEVQPGVGAHAAGPVTTRIIVKYIESESGRVENQEAAREAARALAEIAGVELRHVRLMSGNAQVVEVVGMTGLDSAQAQETIESVVRRIEADPAVEYAEPDSIMQIQHPVNDPRSSRPDLSMFLAGVMSQGADSSVLYRGAGMSAPSVVGAAALLYQIRSGSSLLEVSAILQKTWQVFPNLSGSQFSKVAYGTEITDTGMTTAGLRSELTARQRPTRI